MANAMTIYDRHLSHFLKKTPGELAGALRDFVATPSQGQLVHGKENFMVKFTVWMADPTQTALCVPVADRQVFVNGSTATVNTILEYIRLGLPENGSGLWTKIQTNQVHGGSVRPNTEMKIDWNTKLGELGTGQNIREYLSDKDSVHCYVHPTDGDLGTAMYYARRLAIIEKTDMNQPQAKDEVHRRTMVQMRNGEIAPPWNSPQEEVAHAVSKALITFTEENETWVRVIEAHQTLSTSQVMSHEGLQAHSLASSSSCPPYKAPPSSMGDAPEPENRAPIFKQPPAMNKQPPRMPPGMGALKPVPEDNELKGVPMKAMAAPAAKKSPPAIGEQERDRLLVRIGLQQQQKAAEVAAEAARVTADAAAAAAKAAAEAVSTADAADDSGARSQRANSAYGSARSVVSVVSSAAEVVNMMRPDNTARTERDPADYRRNVRQAHGSIRHRSIRVIWASSTGHDV